MQKKPNILLILNDDMGYSDIGCFGGEIQTLNLDRLADGGLRFTQFYNTARCSPSRAPVFGGDCLERGPLFWEHEGNAAVRDGKWKLVRKYPGPWELYDMESDRTEMNDLAPQYPEMVERMDRQYEAWAARCGVIPRDRILQLTESAGKAFWEDEQ